MKTIYSILLITLAVLATSCGCLHREQLRVKFTQAQKQFFPPYKQNAVYGFIDRNSQSVDFKVAEKGKRWEQHDLMEGGMCSDYASFEYEYIKLESDSDETIHLWIDLNWYEWDENGHFDGVLRWDGSCKIQIGMYIAFLHGKSYLSSEIHIDKEGAILTNDHTFLYESMEIEGEVYQNVVETKTTVERPDTKKVPAQIFYNKDHGILQIKVDGRNYLTLNRKIS